MTLTNIRHCYLWLIIVLLLVGCDNGVWNNPHHQGKTAKNIYFASFSESPKTLDPARSYSSNESLFTAQIYEPPLQYHYLQRPFALIPLTARSMPSVTYYDKQGQIVSLNDSKAQTNNDIAYSEFEIHIKPGILYQPHPAFAKNAQGEYEYHHLQADDLNNINELNDFKHTDSRELTAEDYVYQIKRLAHPDAQSPILGLMSKYIVGLKELSTELAKVRQQYTGFLDLRRYPLAGVKVIDKYTYRIRLKGQYPQFTFWLAMPFFAPMPWEADLFYAQPGMADKNLSLDWYPVGTGPYMLSKNNPNGMMVLTKNPNFRGELFPNSDNPVDQQQGYLHSQGLKIPMVDQFVFSLEKESIPRWTKFLQGYYDQSSISSDNFDQAIHVDSQGKAHLSKELAQKKLRLKTSVNPGIFYMGFNMLDPIVGGHSERAKKLRQAISIAMDYEEFISIFMNGRGLIAQGPIPPGIFGYQDSAKFYNPVIYRQVNGLLKRKSIADARQLLAQAGYPNGIDPHTQKPLLLNFDTAASSGPDDKARFAWLRKQFAKLGIDLHIRATQYNRFQEKMRTGNAQIFMWGWLADYPDPENFLFLLYGPNSKAKFGGENAANYMNPKYDRFFKQMQHLSNGKQRLAIIQEMVALVQQDAPWIWGFFPQTFQLSHQWLYPQKPNAMANNTLKYVRLDAKQRSKMQKQWNQVILWPILLVLGLLILLIIPVAIKYWRKEYGGGRS